MLKENQNINDHLTDESVQEYNIETERTPGKRFKKHTDGNHSSSQVQEHIDLKAVFPKSTGPNECPVWFVWYFLVNVNPVGYIKEVWFNNKFNITVDC